MPANGHAGTGASVRSFAHHRIVSRAIAFISGDRVPDGCRMHPDLVRTTGRQMHLGERRVSKTLQRHKVRQGSSCPLHPPAHAARHHAAHR